MFFLECKPIEVPVGRRLLGSVSTVDSSAALVCDAGFVPDTTVVTCTANGTWIPHPSPCGIFNLNISSIFISITMFYYIFSSYIRSDIVRCIALKRVLLE